MVSALTMLWNSVCTTTSNSIESINSSGCAWHARFFCLIHFAVPLKSLTFATALQLSHALVAELVDAPDLGSGVLRRAGSSPVRRTKNRVNYLGGK